MKDTGVGIPAENLPHIFDRFYRVRNAQTNKIQGLGLGLSFVAWIVDAHGGKIDVTSTPGEGTVFTIRLPADTSPHKSRKLPLERFPIPPAASGVRLERVQLENGDRLLCPRPAFAVCSGYNGRGQSGLSPFSSCTLSRRTTLEGSLHWWQGK